MKTLFIGNSHTFYNDMPQTFAKLYATGQHTQMETVMLAHPSVDLEWHVKEFFDIRYNLLYGNNDFCIIQQAAHPFPGTNTTIENVMKINELCQEAGTHLYVTLTWAKKSSPQDQELMNHTYEELNGVTNITVSPVGKIWMEVNRKYPDIELYARDGAHPSPYGDYLVACTHYAVITGDSTSELPFTAHNFLRGRTKCPDNSGVINDIEKIVTVLDGDKCCKIQTEVDQFISSHGPVFCPSGVANTH